MARRREGMTVRSCGCITYEYGPPIKCPKHEAKDKVAEENALRRAVREHAFDNGHDLTLFSEYESFPGKYTAFCNTCGHIVIVYDVPPERGDQINGKGILSKRCGEIVT
jgi:hypothetical protein